MSAWYAAFSIALTLTGCSDDPERSKRATSDSSVDLTEVDSGESGVACTNSFPVDPTPVSTDAEVSRPPPLEEGLPEQLSDTPLYEDIATGSIHPAVREFQPQFQLWSDGADKRRWAYIPECDTVDTDDIDHWHFPVGTRFFKEFSRDGVRYETRIMSRTGGGLRDWAMASYAWNEDQTDAVRVGPEGRSNVLGSTHDIPSKAECLRCHGSHGEGGGRPSRGLGFSAIQLAHSGDGLTLQTLMDDDILSTPPPGSDVFTTESPDREALGYLHVNCGHCHNDGPDRVPQVDLNFWIDANTASLEEAGVYRTAVNQDTVVFSDQHVEGRIVSGDPEHSAVLFRMANRGNNAQMPPVGTEFVDEDGIELLTEWIGSLP
jgi:mono/diheme cytochrome c family protein